jgi:exopolysaccharide production protein ExoY
MNVMGKRQFSFNVASWPDHQAAMDIAVPFGGTSRSMQAAEQAAATVAHAPDQTALGDRGMFPRMPLGGWPKRAADVMIAMLALILAAPVMLAVALLIRTTMKGPAMFSHRRVGFNGKPFNCYKFRSMVTNSDQVLREYLASNPEAAREWEANRKLKRDPRVTLLGQMLRKSSLDELPQLFNILRGDMSCVGPRPIVQDELKNYGEHVHEYLSSRPGLTGLWQVTGRSSTEYSTRVALDSEYVRHWSLGADVVILTRTVFAVMRFDRAS